MAYGIVSSASSTIIDGTGTRQQVTVPTLSSDTFVYSSGSTVDITDYLEDYDPDTIYIGGTVTATNAGEYTTIIDLKNPSTTEWNDEEAPTGFKLLMWRVNKQTVSVPTVTDTSKTYNTNEQSPTIAAYDTDVIDVSGNTATNAGNYTIEFTLKDTTNYQWASGSTPSVSWSIAKAAGSVSVSPTSLTLTIDSSTKTATVTRSGNGAITATSSNTSVATCSVSNTTVSVTAVDNGTTTIRVNVAEGTNYLATSTTISITSNLPSTTLNNNTWSIISEIAQAGTGDTYWDIGDCKQITLNGTVGDSDTGSQTYTAKSLCVFILDFNHAMNGVAENNIIFGGFKTAVTSGKDVALYSFKMNSSNTNANGWKGCDLRFSALGNGSSKNTDATQANITSPKANTMMSAIPADMRAVVRLWDRWIDNTGGSTNLGSNGNSADKVTQVTDCCSLLAECEIFASRSYANTGEASHSTRMVYYMVGNSTKKYNADSDSSAVLWWECSPAGFNNVGGSYLFCYVYTDGNASWNKAIYAYGLAPAWKI